LLREDSVAIERTGFELEGEAAALRATAYARTNFPIAATAAVAHAVQALERARMTLGSGLLRASFAADRADLYARLIDVELRTGRPRAALRIADLARARPLTVLVRESADPAALALLRVRELNDNVNELLAASADGDDTQQTALGAVQSELTQARAEYESIVARGAWQPGAAAASSLEGMAAALRPDEALLEYFVADDRVFAFVATGNAVRAQMLALSAPQLLARIRTARAALASDTGDGRQALASLHDALIAPFADEIAGRRRLVIVPHAALSYLPFAALRSARTDRYLIEDYVIQYLPAASELARLRQAPAIEKRPRALVLQPFPEQLPGTRAEAKAVKSAWRGRILKGARASSDAMRAAVATDNILHVSSHAAMDAQTPLFSYVSLARGESDDGRFEVHDVFASRVRNPLVYLSGCETGLGAASATGYESGADASTFAHAFLAAGARGVVSTVWRIEDGSAAVFARDFYRQLRNHDAAEAVARAQRELLKSAAYRQPFYWAPYMLTGDVEFGG
jgi:CHAT domain-containing protein